MDADLGRGLYTDSGRGKISESSYFPWSDQQPWAQQLVNSVNMSDYLERFHPKWKRTKLLGMSPSPSENAIGEVEGWVFWRGVGGAGHCTMLTFCFIKGIVSALGGRVSHQSWFQSLLLCEFGQDSQPRSDLVSWSLNWESWTGWSLIVSPGS